MNLFEAARRRRLEAHRPGTRRNMISCQRLYLQFCLVMDIPLETPGVDDLGAFAEWLIRAGMAPSTIANYLSAVKTLYLMWDLSEPIEVFNSYAWSLTMKAVKHAVRPVLNNRAAVTFDHLKLLVRACNREAALGFWKWVTVPMLRIMMRRAAHLAGLSEFGYTPHSLRRGGASFSYLAGVPLDHIKFHGTWTSNAVEGYLVSQPRFNTPVAQAFKSLITP